jgi:hypothetical protein
MNQTIKEATVKRLQYETHDQLRRLLGTSLPTPTSRAASRRCAASRPTKQSAKHRQMSRSASPQARTINLRDQTSSAQGIHELTFNVDYSVGLIRHLGPRSRQVTSTIPKLTAD